MIRERPGKVVDSYRFLGPAGKILRAAIPQQAQYDHIPWTPLQKPVAECRVALLTTSGVSLAADVPFDMERERRNPLWGDPGFRAVPSWAREGDVEINHIHINAAFATRDLNVVLPFERFHELAAAGEIGRVADTGYSIMGYNTDPTEQVCRLAPRSVERMQAESVDVAFLVPV